MKARSTLENSELPINPLRLRREKQFTPEAQRENLRRKEDTVGATNTVFKNLLGAFILIPAASTGVRLPAEGEVRTVKVGEVPGYTEGVVIDRDGAVFISDVYHGTIYRVAP